MCIRDRYKAKPIRFSAPIDHDMASLATGLPPGTTTELTIIQTSDKFRILTGESAPYSLEIKDIMLLIPTRMLAPDIFRDLQISMRKEPGFLSFRQMTVDKYICQKNLTVFTACANKSHSWHCSPRRFRWIHKAQPF